MRFNRVDDEGLERPPRRFVFVRVHVGDLLPYAELCVVERRDACHDIFDECLAVAAVSVSLVVRRLQLADDVYFDVKNFFGQARHDLSFRPFLVGAEKLKVTAEVKDEKALFILADAVQVGAEPRPPPDHLPKLRLGAHFFKKNEVDNMTSSNTWSMIVAVRNRLVDVYFVQRALHVAAVDEQRQLLFREKAGHLARRIGEIVPHVCRKPVRIKNDGALPVHFFEAVGVQFRLLLP